MWIRYYRASRGDKGVMGLSIGNSVTLNLETLQKNTLEVLKNEYTDKTYIIKDIKACAQYHHTCGTIDCPGKIALARTNGQKMELGLAGFRCFGYSGKSGVVLTLKSAYVHELDRILFQKEIT